MQSWMRKISPPISKPTAVSDQKRRPSQYRQGHYGSDYPDAKMQLPPERYDFTAVYTKDEAVNLSAMQYFMYTLIGMISIYSYFTAVTSFSTYQANISTLVLAQCIPLEQGHGSATSAIVSLIFCFLSNIIALLHIQLVLGVELVNNLAPTILILFVPACSGSLSVPSSPPRTNYRWMAKSDSALLLLSLCPFLPV